MSVGNAPLRVGDHVRVLPTQGSYQEPKNAVIEGETRTRWYLRVEGEMALKVYRKDDGFPFLRWDKMKFPCYRMERWA